MGRSRNLTVVSADFHKSTEEHEQMLPKKTPLGPGSSGPDVVMLQKVLIKLGYMHPSAIRCFQGFYGPRTTASVAKIASAIGCSGGGVFTDRVRAYLLKRLGSVSCESRRAGPVSVPVMVLRKLSTMVPPKKDTVSVRKLPSVTVTTTTESATVALTTEHVTVPANTEPATVAPTTEPVTVAPITASVSVTTTTEPATVAPTTEPVSIPKTNETVPTATTKSAAVPVKVQQLLDMGFALPIETLTNILAAANDDVSMALNALVGSF